MSNSFSVGDIANLAQSLLEKHNQGKEFMLEDIYKITRQAYEQFPKDPVINQVAFAIERMAEKARPGATITQAEISKLYNNFVRLSSNTRFKDVLGNLLMPEITKKAEKQATNRLDFAGEGIKNEDLADQEQVNTIVSAFDSSKKPVYNRKIAENGIKLVQEELKSIGFRNVPIKIFGGTDKNIIYCAQFDSNRGPISVIIPTEINKNSIEFPKTFIADDHVEALTASNVNVYVEKKADSGFVDSKIKESRPELDLTPKAEMPEELAHLTRDFEDSVLEAASSFGLDAIKTGKEVIFRELKSAGFKNTKVKFGSETTSGVIYIAGIRTPRGIVDIEVPVEMHVIADNKYIPLIPTHFAYDGIIEDFTAPKLQRFAVSCHIPSTGTQVYSSTFSYMTLPELKDEIVKAASDNDYVTCETILGEIQDRFPEETFKNSLADYQYLLMQKAKIEKQEQFKCAKMIPAGKGSIYPRCGHYGVPMHKVVTDEHGNCKLKTAVEKEKLNPVEESGATISTSKIFMS